MDILKPYRFVFGKPGEGIHSYRILDVAAVDYFLTIAGAMAIAWMTRIPLVLSTIGLFALGLVLHWAFGLRTSAVAYLEQSI